jgi:hypothetical protein
MGYLACPPIFLVIHFYEICIFGMDEHLLHLAAIISGPLKPAFDQSAEKLINFFGFPHVEPY